MIDRSHRVLGCLPSPRDDRDLMLGNYLRTDLPEAPESCLWGRSVRSWPMLGNDVIGDCAFAAAAHMFQCWTSDARVEAEISELDVVHAYSEATGYDGTPATDRGASAATALKYLRRVGIAGHRIGAFARVEPRSVGQMRHGIYLFGGVYLALALPISAQTQEVWDVPEYGPIGLGAPGSWGGHAVLVRGYDNDGIYHIVSWDESDIPATPAFVRTYAWEADAILSADWISPHTQLAPVGLDVSALLHDLVRVAA